MLSDEAMAARAVALRAEAVRGDGGRSIVVGIAAVAMSEIFIVATLGGGAGLGFWLHTAAVTLVIAATFALLIAHHLVRPADAALLDRWLPVARGIGLLLNLTVILSPWVLLPLVGPVTAGVFYLLYAWFLAVTATFNTDDKVMVWLPLLGVPLSLSAYLLAGRMPLAVPLSAFFCLFGVSLLFFERRRRRLQAEGLAARIEGERAAARLLARLESMSLIPRTASSDARPDDIPDGGVLTPRQVEVLRHVARGQSNKQIARELNISPATVKVHVAQILAATGAGNRTEAAVSMLRQA